MELDKSILIQKQVKDNSEDLQSEFLDLKIWEEQMKRKEKELLSGYNEEQTLPPIRSKTKNERVTEENKMTESSKRIKPCDYTEWDKLDIEKMCKELDGEEQSDDSAEDILPKMELKANYKKAVGYKLQGNKFVQQKNWNKAIAAYNKAIQIFPYDAVFYANRALCYLKQDNLYSAEADCSSAIQMDENYVKAYLRRATARIALKQYREAKQDVEKILMLEPSDKEAKELLRQVNEHLKNLKPIIISGKDTGEDISIEKKIGEKMLGNVKSNVKIVEIKEDENKKNELKEVAAKPKTINVTKKDTRIPDWLPEKDDVAIVESIEKPPHLRSKEPFKKIPVQEADLTKPFKDEIKSSCSRNQSTELLNKHSDITNHKEIATKHKLEENSTKSDIELSIPRTACQFILNWRKYTSPDLRYKYIKQLSDLPSNSFSKIFQDSMESNIFSDILTILNTEFIKRKEPIFFYLKDLSDVKRFRTFVMFLSNSERKDLKLMFSYCKTFEKIPEEEVAELQNKYEVD